MFVLLIFAFVLCFFFLYVYVDHRSLHVLTNSFPPRRSSDLFVNDAYRRMFGDRDFLGKTVRQAFPELEGQGFYEWMDKVYATGERFVAERLPIRLDYPGAQSGQRDLDLLYERVNDERGRVDVLFYIGSECGRERVGQ